jgi:DHA1 family multidrug resistance protein-like MFS transporter
MSGMRARIAVLMLSAAMMNVAYTMLIPLVPELTGRFHLSALQIAAAFSGFALAKALAQPIGGILVDRVARPPVLGCVGLCLTAVTIGGLAFADAGWQVLAWRLAWGVAEGITMPVLYRLASSLGASSHYGTTRVMGWFGGSCTAGMVIGPAVVGLLYVSLGFMGVFLAGAVVTGSGGVLLLALRYRTVEPEAEETVPARRGGSVRLLALLVGVFAVIDLVNNGVFAAMEPVVPLHLDHLTGNGVGATSIIFTAGLAVFMLVTLTCARFIESRPLLLVAAVSFGIEAVGLVVVGVAGGVVLVCAGFLVFMTAQPVVYMIARRGVNLVPAHQLGRAFGAFGLVSDIGFIVGPLLGTLLYSRGGASVFVVMGVIAAVAGVGALFVRRLPDRLVDKRSELSSVA